MLAAAPAAGCCRGADTQCCRACDLWQAVCPQIIGGLLPILTFVGIGLEHSVANMFLIPVAIALGADITLKQFLVRRECREQRAHQPQAVTCVKTAVAA